MTELVEIVHVGSGRCRVSRRRAWSDGRLVDDSRIENIDVDRIVDADTVLVETFFGSREEESLYWDSRSGAVLAESVVRWRGMSERVSCGRLMLDEFAPSHELPGATFFARLICRGMALDPNAGFEVDLRLLNGRPVGVEERDSTVPAEPEVVVSGNTDEMFTWSAGLARLPDLASISFDRGNVFLLGTVAGTLSIAGGFTIPASWVTAVEFLVGLVSNHRGLLDEGKPPA